MSTYCIGGEFCKRPKWDATSFPIMTSPVKYEDEIQQASYSALKSEFNLNKVFEFCWKNRVEILVQDDCMCHCYINYKEGDGSYSAEIDALSALIVGIDVYINHNSENSQT